MISKNRRRGDTLCASEFVSVPKNGHYCLLRQFPISQDIGHEWTQILNYLNHGVMLKLLSLQKQATWQYSKFRCCLWRQQAPQVNIGCKRALSYFDIFSGDVVRISRIWFIWFLDVPAVNVPKMAYIGSRWVSESLLAHPEWKKMTFSNFRPLPPKSQDYCMLDACRVSLDMLMQNLDQISPVVFLEN